MNRPIDKMQAPKFDSDTVPDQSPAAAELPAKTSATAAVAPVGRSDAAYLADQAEQRCADTRFDSSRFQRIEDADIAKRVE